MWLEGLPGLRYRGVCTFIWLNARRLPVTQVPTSHCVCYVGHPCRHDLPIADWNGYPLPMVSRKGKPSRPNAEELVWLLRALAVIPHFLSQFPLQARVR